VGKQQYFAELAYKNFLESRAMSVVGV